MELKFVITSYFKQLFQNLRPKLQYSRYRIFVTSHFGTLYSGKNVAKSEIESFSTKVNTVVLPQKLASSGWKKFTPHGEALLGRITILFRLAVCVCLPLQIQPET